MKERRTVRLKAYDYSAQGVYFVTVCVKDRQKILSRIVGTGALTCPSALMVAHLRRTGPARRAPLRRETRRKNAFAVFSHLPDGPQGERTFGVALFEKGKIAERVLRQISDFYENISLDAYVIMPDHIHFLLQIKAPKSGPSGTPVPTSARRGTPCEGGHEGGPSGTPVPTQNSTLSRFVSTFKRFCNKEYGENIWQRRSYDHVIRNQEDYEEHAKYIYENPARRYFADLAAKTDKDN